MSGRSLIESVLVSALVSACITVGGTYYIDRIHQTRDVRAQRALQFTTSTDGLVAAANEYIAAVISGGDLRPIQDKMRFEIGKQVREGDELKIVFDKSIRQEAENYQTALLNLNEEINAAVGLLAMRQWTERLGKVYDRKLALSKALAKQAGVEPES